MVVLGAGSRAADAADAADAQGVLKIGMTVADIPYTGGQPDQGAEGNRFTGITMYDSLIQLDLSKPDKPPVLIPDLATHWEPLAGDKTHWIFTLRAGVTFHDGTPFNADAVVWNVQKLLDRSAPQFDARQAGLTLSRMPTLRSAHKIDDLHVEIVTSVPDAFLPYNALNLYMASPSAWRKQFDALAATVSDPQQRAAQAWNAFAAHPVGTGPFKGISLVPHQRLEMVPNAQYWDPARRPHIAKLILFPMPEASARTAALLSGQVDWIEAPAPDSIKQLQARGFKIYANTQPQLWPWQFSFAPGSPWLDKRTRQAANLCIDRNGLKTFLGGYMTPATGTYEPGSPWRGQPSFQIKYDPAAARALMTQAGYSVIKPMAVKVQISMSGSGQMQPGPMNEYMQENLKQCYINVQFEVLEWNTLLRNWRLGASDPAAHGASVVNVSLSTFDPFFGLVRFASKQSFPPTSNNWGYFTDETSEKLVEQARTTFDPQQRDAVLGRLNAHMIDEATFLYVAHDVGPRAMSARVHDVVQPQSAYIDIATMRVQP